MLYLRKIKQMLKNHKKVGKKFIAPINYCFQDKGLNVKYHWTSYELMRVPEIIWIDIISEGLGNIAASSLFSEISVIVNKYDKPFFLFNDCFRKISDKSIKEIQNCNEFKSRREEVKHLLSSFLRLYPNNPLTRIIEPTHPHNTDFVSEIRQIMFKLNNRSSKRCIVSLAHIAYSAALGGCTKLPPNLSEPSIILNYPNIPNHEKIASTLRMVSNALFSIKNKNSTNAWNKHFWSINQKYSNWKVKNIIEIN